MPDQSTPDPAVPPCPNCGGPRTFYVLKAPKYAGRRLYVCKPCKVRADAASHQRHRAERNARNSAYYASNRERWTAYWRERYAADPSKKRAAAIRTRVRSGGMRVIPNVLTRAPRRPGSFRWPSGTAS
jgi:hypothetical protein